MSCFFYITLLTQNASSNHYGYDFLVLCALDLVFAVIVTEIVLLGSEADLLLKVA